ncbi:hypothetical protein Ae201684_006966 [Aphanomyces euteiches]|uniref:MULE transposase domain-containing protein n=1 Tax=Aphanomyces euteiches TaxID=100861 RepID=A0A6G0X9N1_9STRA|nr:hypothetical protein Ae201684_006966 [Aphanomyces euteiches]
MIPKLCIDAFPNYQPLIALDGAHMKDLMNANGTLLLATAKDPNNHIIVLGLAIVPVENQAHWTWLLHCLQDSGLLISSIVLVSDRMKGWL